MRVGILDILVDEMPSRGWIDRAYRGMLKKQYAGIMPQVIAVWCRQLGHRVSYATYWGQRDPTEILPRDLDVLFVSAYTQASAIAYVVGRVYQRLGVRTVIGGAHARAFPHDCLRFFDLAVGDCDRALVAEILSDTYDPGTYVTSARPLRDLPTVEERMPEVIASAFAFGHRVPPSTVALLSSTGCPYACDFCVDWDTPYTVLPTEHLAADLRYLARRWPKLLVKYYDPNFAVRFDDVLSVMETIPETSRNRYIMESSLSVLRGPRLARLRDTRCIYAAPGVESWADYSAKSGVGRAAGREKLARLTGQFTEIHHHGIGLQANFMLGTDADRGEEPFALTAEFIRALPFVWPTLNIPTPFGGTPLHERCLAEGRILAAIPLGFYYLPHLVMVPRHYGPLEYYRSLIGLFELMASPAVVRRRVAARTSMGLRTMNVLRTIGLRQDITALRRIHTLLSHDRQFRAFHEGERTHLPAYYHQEYDRRLGRYAGLLSSVDRHPEIAPAPNARIDLHDARSRMAPAV